VPKCFRSVECPYQKVQTAQGSYGAINYSLVGPAFGELVVCLHGLNGSRVLFHDTAEVLSRHGGFQVLSFDLYGHGLSNAPYVDMCLGKGCKSCGEFFCCGRPRGRYDLDFFVEQVDDLLSLLGFGDVSLNLVGFSLGGSIAIAFAQKYPQRVLRLVPMSPAGFLPKIPVSYYLLKAVWCCLIPLAPHVICTCWYKKQRFMKSMRNDGHMDAEALEGLWARFVWQLYVKRGVASATLAICHRIPWFSLKGMVQDVGKHRRPVLLVWGEKDSLNPSKTVAKEVLNCFSNAQLMLVPGAGHIAICDRPRQVVFGLLAFLKLPIATQMGEVDLSSVPPAFRHLQASTSTSTSSASATMAAGATAGAASATATGSAGVRSSASQGEASGTSAGAAGSRPPADCGGAIGAASESQRHAASAAQMPVPMILGLGGQEIAAACPDEGPRIPLPSEDDPPASSRGPEPPRTSPAKMVPGHNFAL